MKRTLAIALTLALLGSLFLAGFAGSAAASTANEQGDEFEQEQEDIEQENEIELDYSGFSGQVAQTNQNAQVGVAAGDDVEDVKDNELEQEVENDDWSIVPFSVYT
jgi:ABC-type glycerol-3-phosphate transport system substrate-binding protein